MKNSWDVNWGEEGYVWIAYDTNKIGYAAAYVRPADSAPVPSRAINAALNQAIPSMRSAAQLADPGAPVDSSLGSPIKPFRVATASATTQIPGARAVDRKTVWIQYGSKTQEADAKLLRGALTNAGYFSPAIENVSLKGGRLPNVLQVRYFSPKEKVVAQQVKQTMEGAGFKNAVVTMVPGYPTADAIEVYFPKEN